MNLNEIFIYQFIGLILIILAMNTIDAALDFYFEYRSIKLISILFIISVSLIATYLLQKAEEMRYKNMKTEVEMVRQEMQEMRQEMKK